MIRYALICAECEATFEAWFASSDSFDGQIKSGAVACPACSGTQIAKQIMAPAVKTSKRRQKPDADSEKMLAAARDHIGETHDYVGTDFADEARAMHYGEIETRRIWGDASAEDQAALKKEGVQAAPLPPALVPKKPVDPTKLN